MKDIYYKKESLFRFIEKYYLHISFTFFLLIIIFSTYKHYGISWDEPGYIMFAKHFIIKIFNTFSQVVMWLFVIFIMKTVMNILLIQMQPLEDRS